MYVIYKMIPPAPATAEESESIDYKNNIDAMKIYNADLIKKYYNMVSKMGIMQI